MCAQIKSPVLSGATKIRRLRTVVPHKINTSSSTSREGFISDFLTSDDAHIQDALTSGGRKTVARKPSTNQRAKQRLQKEVPTCTIRPSTDGRTPQSGGLHCPAGRRVREGRRRCEGHWKQRGGIDFSPVLNCPSFSSAGRIRGGGTAALHHTDVPTFRIIGSLPMPFSSLLGKDEQSAKFAPLHLSVQEWKQCLTLSNLCITLM